MLRGLAAIPGAWGRSAALVPWPIGLNFVWHVTILVSCPKRYFGPFAPNPWHDRSGKCVKAQKWLLPGEIPEQHKFVTGKARILHVLKFYKLRKDYVRKSFKVIPGNAG